jgi:lipopolysaccharide export system permease protein
VPFVLIAALILWMYHILAHRPGGQPIFALEWFFAKTAKYVRQTARAMPRPRRQVPGAAL